MQKTSRHQQSAFLTFLEQLGSKSLVKIGLTIPAYLWTQNETELDELINPSQALIELRKRFWIEATQSWHGKKRFSLHTVFDDGTRTMSYWLSAIRKNPTLLVWILSPLNHLLSIDPAVWGIIVKFREIIGQPILTKTGKPRMENIKILLKLFSIIHPT